MEFKSIYSVNQIESLKDMLSQSEKNYSSKNAFLVKNPDGSMKNITYKEFKHDVDFLGTALIDLGLTGRKIAIIGENRYEWCVSYLSVVNGTGTIVPLDKELPAIELENLLRRSSASAIIFSSKYKKDFLEMKDRLPNLLHLICMDEEIEGIHSFDKLILHGKALLSQGERKFLDVIIDPNVMNILLYTSGTTEMSKAIMLSHRNICSDIMAVCSVINIDHNDSVLSILPLHHTYECTCGFLLMIYNGCQISFCDGLKHIGKNLKEYKPSILILVPIIIEGMYKKIWDLASKKPVKKHLLKLALNFSNFLLNTFNIDLRDKLFKEIHHNIGGNLRLIISGAAAINPEVSKGFRSLGMKILQGYGLTECSPIVSVNREFEFYDESAGQPLPGIDVKIATPDKNGMGEILTKGPNLMLGYFGNEDATKNSIVKGWFHTGDLGKMDDKGFIYITGRKKNVIVTKNGKNIFPEELEALLNKSQYIIESLVKGILEDDSGETIISAQILPDIEAISAKLKLENPTLKEIEKLLKIEVKAINKQLPLYKHIRDFKIRETEFVKTTTRKIKRYEN